MGILDKIGGAIDEIVSVLSPEAGLNRTRSRLARTVAKRYYDAAAKGGRRNANRPGIRNTSAADEVSSAADIIAANSQDLVRNTPLAHRAKMIWASNIVGAGIRAQIDCSNKASQKKANEAFEKWASSKFCDFYGHYDFYGLQWLWAATIAECGGVLVRFHVEESPDGTIVPLRLQTIEQTMLDKTWDRVNTNGNVVRDGIEFDKYGRPVGYWVKTVDATTSVKINKAEPIFLKKDDECIHIFRKERSSQHLGVSWLTQVVTTIDKYNVLIDAKLMQDQIAACMGVIIEGAETRVGLNKDDDRIEELEPAMVQYVPKDSKVHTITPPSSQGSQQFIDIVRSDIAVGAGLSHSQLTGDYSKMNFASGRMSKIEFFQTLDFCQYQMFEPSLSVIAQTFVKYLAVAKRIPLSSIKGVTWSYPPRGVVDPKDEFDYIFKKVRSGFESPMGACKSFGTDFEKIVEQWRQSKEVMGDLPFDIDPSKFSVAGNQLDNNDAAASNADGNEPKNVDGDNNAAD